MLADFISSVPKVGVPTHLKLTPHQQHDSINMSQQHGIIGALMMIVNFAGGYIWTARLIISQPDSWRLHRMHKDPRRNHDLIFIRMFELFILLLLSDCQW